MDEMEYTPDLLTLVDEDGKEETFELIDTYEEGDQKYFAMVPYFEDPDELIQNDGELIILMSDPSGDEENLVSIDDDAEYDRIGKIFLERIEKMFEECDCEDDECDCDDEDCQCHHHEE
ncbi:MAG: DUF1292 domain-containing protein [Oscillospiraceae bacterium]|nr:DUF1292 domain-containing protein [Oscillospiraceae bacterium]